MTAGGSGSNSVSGTTPTRADLSGVTWVHLSFVDLFGVGHSVQLPAGRFPTAVERGVAFDGSALEGRARHLEADMLLRPEPDTLVRLDLQAARVVCTALTTEGTEWAGDPRTALRRVLARHDDLARTCTVAAELELYLVDPDGQPLDEGGYYDEGEGLGTAIVRAAAERLDQAGVDVEGAHHEAGPGQYELDLAPLAPLALADTLVLAKQVVREEAAAAGVRATFMARPFNGEAGSGLHLHQRADGLLAEGSLTPDGRAFVAGQLLHAPALSALAAPTVNSYKRLHSGPEAPSAAVWAHANRAALVRVSSFGAAGTSLEFRGADPSANPYLLLAALLVAGADGIDGGLDPGVPSEEEAGGYDPASALDVRARPLPRDLDGALDALLADDVLVDAFDPQLLARLVSGRRAEAEAYRSQVTEWEVARYLERG